MKLDERLQAVIKRDLGIEVELPVSMNRGYWGQGDVIRWQAKEFGTHRIVQSQDSMTLCVRRGLTPLYQPSWGLGFPEYYTDADLAKHIK